jgi:hypothetical protein
MSPRLLKDEKGSSPSSKGGGGFQESKIYESTRDGEGSGPRILTKENIKERIAQKRKKRGLE